MRLPGSDHCLEIVVSHFFSVWFKVYGNMIFVQLKKILIVSLDEFWMSLAWIFEGTYCTGLFLTFVASEGGAKWEVSFAAGILGDILFLPGPSALLDWIPFGFGWNIGLWMISDRIVQETYRLSC